MTAQIQAWLDREDARTSAMIRKFGWSIAYVSGSGCSRPGGIASKNVPFAYTIGLFGMGHPELLIFGVSPGTAAGVLNSLGERVRSGEKLVPGQMLSFDEWRHRVIPEEVPNPGEIVLGANRHYARRVKDSVPVLQLSYDDLDGRFPWDPRYVAPAMQPRPGSFRA